jgi:hypothetical protein
VYLSKGLPKSQENTESPDDHIFLVLLLFFRKDTQRTDLSEFLKNKKPGIAPGLKHLKYLVNHPKNMPRRAHMTQTRLSPYPNSS